MIHADVCWMLMTARAKCQQEIFFNNLLRQKILIRKFYLSFLLSGCGPSILIDSSESSLEYSRDLVDRLGVVVLTVVARVVEDLVVVARLVVNSRVLVVVISSVVVVIVIASNKLPKLHKLLANPLNY